MTAPPTASSVALPVDDPKARIGIAFDTLFEQDNLARESFAKHAQQRSTDSDALAQRAHKAFSGFDLSRFSPLERKGPQYLRPTDDLNELQHTIIQDGLTAFRQAKTPRALRIVGSEALKALQGSAPNGSKFKLIDVESYVHSKLAGGNIFAKPSAVSLCQAEIEAKRRFQAVLDGHTSATPLPGTPAKRLQVKSPIQIGTAGWPQYAVYDDPSIPQPKKLCQPVGFAILPGTGTAVGGADFSGTGDFGVVLAALQPHVPGHAGDVLFRFVKLGAAQAQPMDVEAFLAKGTTTVTPRILMDAADQLALVVDANRFGGLPSGHARLLDLGHHAATLASFEFDGTTISATVTKKSTGTFEAVVTTDQGARTVALPKT